MAVPTNTSPATAIDLTTLPIDTTLDVTDAPEGLTDVPACVSQAFNAVWYVITAPVGRTYLRISGARDGTSDPGYAPSGSVWTGPDVASLTLLTILDGAGDDQAYCDDLDDGYYFGLPMTPGDTYYVQFVHNDSTAAPTGSILRLRAEFPQSVLAPIGSSVIPDDSNSFPAAVFSMTTGEILQLAPFPAGEFADTQPDGTVLTVNGTESAEVALLDSNWAVVTTRDFSAGGTYSFPVIGIWSDRNGRFYVSVNQSGARSLVTLDGADLSILNTCPITTQFLAGAVSQDGARFYAARTNTDSFIDVYDLTTNTLLTTWDVTADVVYPYQIHGTSARGVGLVDGSFLLPYTDSINHLSKIVRFDATGAVVSDQPSANAAVRRINMLAYYSETQYLVWGFAAGGSGDDPAAFQIINLSDGSVASEVTGVRISGASHLSPAVDVTEWASNSCPIFALTAPLVPPAPPTPSLPPGCVAGLGLQAVTGRAGCAAGV